MRTVERNIDYTLFVPVEIATSGGEMTFSLRQGCPQCGSRKSVKTCSICSRFPLGLVQNYDLWVNIAPNDRHGRIIDIPNVVGDRTVVVTLDIPSYVAPRQRNANASTTTTVSHPQTAFDRWTAIAIKIAGVIKFPFIPRDKNLFVFGALAALGIFHAQAAFIILNLLFSLCFYGWLFRMAGKALAGLGLGGSGGQGMRSQPSYCTKCGHDLSNFGSCYCRQQGEQTTCTAINPNIGGSSSNKTGFTPPPFSSNFNSMGNHVHANDMASASYSSRGYEADLNRSGQYNDASAEASRRYEAERNDRLDREEAARRNSSY